jgi:hypothetical protein
MFTLSFGYSASKNYRKALEIAHSLGGKMEKGTMIIEFHDYELLYTYDKATPLLGIIQKWKTVAGDYNGKRVDPFRFLFGLWRNVAECAQERNNSWDQRHCWLNRDNEGWGCKLVNPFSAFNYGDGMYRRSDRFWYNFGEYKDIDTWKVNKQLIFEKLQKTIENSHVSLCPFFDIERIRRTVENLPGIIKLDAEDYIPYYGEERHRINIRHLPKFENENNPIMTIPKLCSN